MSTLVLVLAAGMAVPGIGPEKVSGEIEERLDLSGEWQLTFTLDGMPSCCCSNPDRAAPTA